MPPKNISFLALSKPPCREGGFLFLLKKCSNNAQSKEKPLYNRGYKQMVETTGGSFLTSIIINNNKLLPL